MYLLLMKLKLMSLPLFLEDLILESLTFISNLSFQHFSLNNKILILIIETLLYSDY